MLVTESGRVALTESVADFPVESWRARINESSGCRLPVTGAKWAVKPGKRKKNKAIFTAFVLVEEHDKSGRFSPGFQYKQVCILLIMSK